MGLSQGPIPALPPLLAPQATQLAVSVGSNPGYGRASLAHSAHYPRPCCLASCPTTPPALSAGPSDLLARVPRSPLHGNPVVTLITPMAPPVEIADFLSVGPVVL